MSKATAEPAAITYKWAELQTKLSECSDEKELTTMLTAEREGPKRIQWLLRIHGRFNLIRQLRERKELIEIAGKVNGE